MVLGFCWAKPVISGETEPLARGLGKDHREELVRGRHDLLVAANRIEHRRNRPMTRRVRRPLVATGLATLALLFPTVSAQAATDTTAASCREGSVCTWSKNDFGGTKFTSRLYPEPGCNHWNGKTVSNQSGRTIRVYSDVSCTGQYVDIQTNHWAQTVPGATINSIAVLGP